MDTKLNALPIERLAVTQFATDNGDETIKYRVMNNAVYNHMNKNLEKLCDRQSKAWRNLKNMKIEWRNRFCLTDDERFELEQCQHEYDSLTDRIDQLKDRLLTFELFGE